MPQSPWDKDSESTEKQMDPELNPLVNPTLGRNLGKWAQVCFTTPPERRDQAVGELLRELNGEAPPRPGIPADLPPQIVCSACGYGNPGFQKFCGMCGAPLPARPSGAAPVREEFEPGNVAQGRTETPVPPPSPVIHDPLDRRQEDDMEWLRSRSVLGTADIMDSEPSRVWKFMVVVVALIIVGFAFMYARGRLASLRGGQAATSPAPQQAGAPVAEPEQPLESRTEAPPEAKAPAPKEETQGAAGETQAGTQGNKPAAEAANGEVPSQPGAVAAQKKRPPVEGAGLTERETAAPADESNAAGGVEELREAQRYLGANGGARDTTAAARLLWKAVGKKNPDAVVLLADLYSHGDGVPQSCDQARLLLTAAVKNGTPGAATRLQSLPSTCR